MDFKPPRTYLSTYEMQFKNASGMDFVGSPSQGDGAINLDGLHDKRGPPKKAAEIASPFIGSSSYKNYDDYGALPKANIKAQKKF